MNEYRKAILSLDAWVKLGKTNAINIPSEQATFPMGTQQLVNMLANRGITLSLPSVERAVKAAELVIPTIGRTRTWGEAQVETLIDNILTDPYESGTCPSYFKPFAAWFWYYGISADEWCHKHQEFKQAHKGRFEIDGLSVFRPWHAIPYGAKLVIHSDMNGDHAFEFEVDETLPLLQGKHASGKKSKAKK